MAGILSASADGRRGERLLLAGMAAIWLLFSLPLLLGERTLILRDVFTTHLPWKAFGAAALAHGSIPAFNPDWALGQPFAGDPNALAFYPGNLLYLILPFWSAFNAHYVLHWMLAFLAFRKLGRELDQSPLAATLAGLTYAGSGYVLSCLSFYNLIAVAAWLPLVLWGLARGGSRGTLWGGIACGLMLLSGEPITAALSVAVMALVAVERHGWKKGFFSALSVGGLGLVVALPQVVAAARVFGFTYRGAHGLLAVQAANHALQLPRLLELLLPLPWGWPSALGRFGYWSSVTPITPYIYSLHFGVVALGLAFFAPRNRWRWAVLVGASLLLAVLGGLSGETVLKLSGGLFRYPQKLLLCTTVGAALLAGWGFDRLLPTAGPWKREQAPREEAAREEAPPEEAPAEEASPEEASDAGRARAARLLWLGAGVAGCLAVILLLLRGPVRAVFSTRLGAGSVAVAATQQTQWFLGCATAALLVAGAAWAVRRRSGVALVGLQALALLQLSPMVGTDRVDALAPPAPWVERLGSARSVALVSNAFPLWARNPPMRAVESIAEGWRDARLGLDPATGALHGLSYPVAPDLDGIFSPLQALLNENLAHLRWPERIRWLRLLGAAWLVRADDGEPPPPLEQVAAETYLRRNELYRIPDPAPMAFWPREVLPAESPIRALAMMARVPDMQLSAVASRGVDHHADGRVQLLSAEDDRLHLAVESAGGLLVVQRAYFPLIEARLEDGSRLATQPVDLVLLGIEVPSGRHEIRIGTSSRPEAVAGGLSLIVFVLAAGFGWRRP